MDKTNKDTADNFQVFFSTIRRYFIFLMAITVVGAAAVGFREKTKAPQYSVESQIKFDANILNEINSAPNEVIAMDKVYENMAEQQNVQDIYKKSTGSANADKKTIASWAMGSITVQQEEKYPYVVDFKAVSADKTQAKALADAYYSAVDSVLKDISYKYYSKEVIYADDKIKIIAQKIKDASINDNEAYSKALDKWADYKMKMENYISPLTVIQTKETVVTTGKKALLNYMFVGAVGGFLLGIFLIFLIDYSKNLKKSARSKVNK